MLKRAGYDGLIVTGASETPVQIRIRDHEVSVLPARATPPSWFSGMNVLNRRLAEHGDGEARLRGCTALRVTPCAVHFRDVPGCVFSRKWSGDWVCIALRFQGRDPIDSRGVYGAMDWHLARRAAFEVNVLTNRDGLDQFAFVTGIVPWLMAGQAEVSFS